MSRSDDMTKLVENLDQQVELYGREIKETGVQNEMQLKRLGNDITRLEEHVEKVKELCRLRVNNESISPCAFKMSQFHRLKRGNASWFSPGFYTHLFGYKMQLKVDANGAGNGTGTHVSVYLCLMEGDYDSTLTWPLKYKCFITLLNQLNDQRHYTQKVIYLKDIADDFNSRVRTNSGGHCAWGDHQFIPHDQLGLQEDKQCQYLKDDRLNFIVEIDVCREKCEE